MYTDDGIVLRFADGENLPELSDLLPDAETVEDRVMEQLADTALFAGLFRENAARSLLMPRKSAKGRQPLWAQRLKAQNLLSAVRRYPSFPMVLETYRQALSDVFDLPGLQEILRSIQARSIRVHEVTTRTASPFARSLVFAYVAAYIYEQDAPLAERRTQALTLDRGLLVELLGQAELRELIDPLVLDELEAELQHLPSDRHARDTDGLHDLLRRLGDLSSSELADRCAEEPSAWIDTLAAQLRAVPVQIAEERRWIATEDAALYRDALGCLLPPGLPDSFLTPSEAPLEHLLRRYANTHGPFLSPEPAARMGLHSAQVEPALRLLESRGLLVRGEIRPAGAEPEWCDTEVVRRLRRRTLARLRHTVAPVDATTLGRFLPSWHGIGEDLIGQDRLMDAFLQLEGLTISWFQLDRMILPARVPGYQGSDLDIFAATGRLVWVGRGAAGPRDGRIALYRRERVAALYEPNTDTEQPTSELHALLLRHLRERGACFLMELIQTVERSTLDVRNEDFEASLWDLVWAGMITNDTFSPLKALAGSARRQRHGREPALAGGRWSLVADLLSETPDTQRLIARAQILLKRYGVVSREAVQAEGVPVGFGPLYRLLKQMEESGRVRRGYFVKGLSGAQFALAGAVERLRSARSDVVPVDGWTEQDLCILAAIDPANPFGALLPWPKPGGGTRPKRVGGAWVILVAGKAILYLGTNGAQLQTFPESIGECNGELNLAVTALHRVPRTGRKRLLIRNIDSLPTIESPLRERLLNSGFEADYDAIAPSLGYYPKRRS